MVVTNAISLNMLPADVAGGAIVFLRVTAEDARRLAASGPIESAIGHADTARVVGRELGIELAADRRTITLGSDPVLVAQYIGPRLPEGATELPEGARIEFFVVALSYDDRSEAARNLGLAV